MKKNNEEERKKVKRNLIPIRGGQKYRENLVAELGLLKVGSLWHREYPLSAPACFVKTFKSQFFSLVSISSFHLFLPPSCLGVEHHNGVNLSIWRERVLREILLAGPIFLG